MKKFFLFDNTETETKVSNTRLLSYAAGLTGQNMTYNFVSNRLFVYLNTILKIPSEKTGIITGVSTLWDAINDPLIGGLIDRRKHKPGQKMRPFLLWTPIIIGILVFLMFVDFGFKESQTIAFVLILYILFDVVYSLQDISIWGIAAMSSPDSTERGRVIQWISIAAGLGGTLGGLFPTFKDMFVKNEIMTEKSTYVFGAMIFGLGGMLIAMLAYRMKEKVEPAVDEKKSSILGDIWDLRHNKTLIIVCLARTVQSISIALPWEYFFETQGLAYNVFGAEISGGTAQVVYGFIMGIPGAIAMFFAIKLIKRLGGNKNLLVFSEAITIVARVLAFFVGANDRFLNIGALGIVMLLLGTAQVFTNMKDIAHRSLLTNSIDEVELETGKRTEGIVFSMQNFVSKLTGAIPKFIQGYVLKFLGFDPNIKHAANQTVINAQVAPRFLKYRWHQFILGPAIGSALYLIVILFLKDDQTHIAEVERQLRAKREAAALESEKVEA
ncbi:MAG: MFS transporter [Clostridia bacterium]|nr:MFS transporter [Clostridia bacterium]